MAGFHAGIDAGDDVAITGRSDACALARTSPAPQTPIGPVWACAASVVIGLCLPQAVLADSVSPILIPGFSVSSASLIFVLLAAPLATILEVPYVSTAGLRDRVWRRTLEANVISTGIGFFLPLSYMADRIVDFNVLVAAAIALSIATEGLYLAWKAKWRLNWGWLAVGNVTSSVVLLWLSSFWAVAMDRAPESLRELGATADYSWYRHDYYIGCVNAALVDDERIRQWVPHLKALRARTISLSGSRVTDEGLKSLMEVPTLTWLDSAGCRGYTTRD